MWKDTHGKYLDVLNISEQVKTQQVENIDHPEGKNRTSTLCFRPNNNSEVGVPRVAEKMCLGGVKELV